jgi:hypothetical protein
MLAIEVHRHPAVAAILDVRGIAGGLDLAAADRASPAERDWRSIPGLQANVGCPLGYTKLPFATTAASGRDGWIALLQGPPRAIDEAAKRDQPVSVCIAPIYGSTVFVWSGNLQRAEDFIERLLAHARRHSLAPYSAVGTGLKGELAIARGEPKAGFELVRNAIEILSAEQHNILLTVFERALADGLRNTRQFDQALRIIDGAIARASTSGASYDMAELLRIKAEIVASMPWQDRTAAIDCVTAALGVAREQSALALELRSTMVLARLLADSGQRDSAQQVLRLVYNRFTEGFETADLRSARDLIEDLA